MIEAAELRQKLGKEKFVQFTLQHANKGERIIDIQRRRRFGRNIKHKRCEHGVWIIKDYEPQVCEKCFGKLSTQFKSFEPYFDQGLGCFIESKCERKRIMKERGVIDVGMEGLR